MASPLKKRWILLVIAFVALAGSVWIWVNPDLRPVVISIYEPPILKPSEITHDLGVIETDSKFSHTFQLYNVGGKPLIIRGVDVSCGCTVAKLAKTTLKPGEHTDLVATLDTSIKLGNVKKTITILSNDPKNPKLDLFLLANVTHRMRGHEPMEVKDPLVLFKGKCATCHVNNGIGKTGQALFVADCAMCHGMKAQGNVAMPLLLGNFENPEYRAYVHKVISEGSPRTPEMPPFSQAHGGPLSNDQIDSLIQFLAYLSTQPKE